MSTDSLTKRHVAGSAPRNPGRVRGKRRGAALFIALACLSLFSLMGATYVRYMSIEIDINARQLHALRARHYAVAGIESARGHIVASTAAGTTPNALNTFTYGVYGTSGGMYTSGPPLLETFSAEAQVVIETMDKDAWNARFGDDQPWPGEEKAFRVISKSEVKRADTGRMRLLGTHAVESVIVLDAPGCTVVSWGTYRE